MNVRDAATDVDIDLAAPHQHLSQLFAPSLNSGLHT
jgi:hypothetical protein